MSPTTGARVITGLGGAATAVWSLAVAMVGFSLLWWRDAVVVHVGVMVVLVVVAFWCGGSTRAAVRLLRDRPATDATPVVGPFVVWDSLGRLTGIVVGLAVLGVGASRMVGESLSLFG